MLRHLVSAGPRSTASALASLLLSGFACVDTLAATSAATPAAVKAIAGRRVMWLGDSITQDGKYVTFFEYYLDREFRKQTFDFISIGLASETVSGLSEKTHPFPRPCVFERLDRALTAVKPAVVIACYGMNDGIYHPRGDDRMQAFQDGIRRLSTAVHAARAELILLTPAPFDPTPVRDTLPADAPDFSYARPFVDYDSVLADFSRWELGVPKRIARLVVDLHGPMDQERTRRRQTDSKFTFSGDGIHPGELGHFFMARTLARGFGLQVSGDDLEAELAKVQADPLFKLVRQRREARSGAWLDYVGYTRGKTVKTDSVDAAEKTAADLARLIAELKSRGGSN